MAEKLITGECRFCGRPVYLVGTFWYDESDGDSCWGDDDGNNKNEAHQVSLDANNKNNS